MSVSCILFQALEPYSVEVTSKWVLHLSSFFVGVAPVFGPVKLFGSKTSAGLMA
jgi:hypothetical protein